MVFQKCLKPGFRHCLAFSYDAVGERWVIVDPLFDGAFIRALPSSEVDAFIAHYRIRGTILRCRVKRTQIKRPRLLLTCVSVITNLLGVATCAVTPYQLYRYLVRNGATPAFEG